MYSEVLLDHFHHPRHLGELPPPAQVIEAVNPACGDVIRLSVLWAGERVEAAAFRVRGCTAAIAAGSVLTEWLHGRSRADLAQLTATDLEQALGGLPPTSRHAASLCLDAVKGVLQTPSVAKEVKSSAESSVQRGEEQ